MSIQPKLYKSWWKWDEQAEPVFSTPFYVAALLFCVLQSAGHYSWAVAILKKLKVGCQFCFSLFMWLEADNGVVYCATVTFWIFDIS